MRRAIHPCFEKQGFLAKFSVKALLEREGIICRSPRTCFRELFSAGLIDEETVRELLKMVEDRNLTVHTYREEVAEEIFNRLPGYLKALEKLIEL